MLTKNISLLRLLCTSLIVNNLNRVHNRWTCTFVFYWKLFLQLFLQLNRLSTNFNFSMNIFRRWLSEASLEAICLNMTFSLLFFFSCCAIFIFIVKLRMLFGNYSEIINYIFLWYSGKFFVTVNSFWRTIP